VKLSIKDNIATSRPTSKNLWYGISISTKCHPSPKIFHKGQKSANS